MEREIRSGVPVEIRAESNGVKVSGYAAVFGQQADIAGLFTEVIEPGAFRGSLGKDDVVFLINHGGLPLARTASNTLALTEDAHGLKMETMLDGNDPDAQRIIPKMQRGDLNKMSFAFEAVKQTWDDTKNPPVRTIHEARLYDVSIVTTPAYSGTEIGLRSLEEARKERRRSNAERRIEERKRKAESENRFRNL